MIRFMASTTAHARGAIVALALFACGGPRTDPPAVSTSTTGLAQWVDPLIGTTNASADNASFVSVANGGGGSTNPAATVPFGMVQWGPDTPRAVPPGYEYTDSSILGFSVTHIDGAGCPSFRDFPIYPVTGDWDPTTEQSDTFTHQDEIAAAGFYEVKLGSGIKVDITATTRTGLARFTFPHDKPGTLLVGATRPHEGVLVSDASLSVAPDGTITGQRTRSLFCGTPIGFKVYFAARFDRPFRDSGAYDAGGSTPNATTATGEAAGLYFDFDTGTTDAVHMKIGVSYVSVANALANLDAESPGWDFEAVHASAVAAWNDALGHAVAEGGTDDQMRVFYTGLYHALLSPSVASDVDGEYMGFDDAVHTASGYVRYQNYSGWDVYRSWIQLVSAIAPKQANDIARSLAEAGNECGALPRWPIANREASEMIGDPGAAFLANAYAFGARGFDAKAALALMVHAANDPTAACQSHPIRPGLGDELTRQYLASDSPTQTIGTVATTIEYALDDYAIAQLAAAVGDDATHTTFLARSAWWKNVFDPNRTANSATGYFQPRDEAGTFDESGDVKSEGQLDLVGATGFIEGNATQYTLALSHDLPGLITLLGGDAAFIARLDPFFTQVNAGLGLPYFYIGNEPGFSTPFAYAFAGAPSRTQAVVRQVLAQAYTTQPSGLPGNDDLGAMSAWAVWAMLGMYPVVPASSTLVLTTPTFPKMTLTIAGGATVTITADNPSAPYVQSLTVDGTPTTHAWIDWSSLASGGTIQFALGANPSTWGTAQADRPPTPQ
jgi:predicted alpha-1,2-mannosidase